MKPPKPELLAPAGEAVALRAALNAGADAVYFGAGALNMRKRARNFSMEDIPDVVASCRKAGAKAYLAMNTIVYEPELRVMEQGLDIAAEAQVDAIICWDGAVIDGARERGLEVHLSTQASVSNSREIMRRYKQDGIRRFVLARECSLPHIKAIRSALELELGEDSRQIELEAFIHGAMCVSVSGRCFMSEYSTGQSANRGACLQPCRRKYRIIDVEGEYEYEMGQDFIMSPRDMCTMPLLEKVLDAGIASLKIEGRMRNPEYVSTVVGAYRQAVDFWYANLAGKQPDTGLENTDSPEGALSPEKALLSEAASSTEDPLSPEGALSPEKAGFEALKRNLTEELRKVFNRGFSPGFYMGRPAADWTRSPNSLASRRKESVGIVVNYFRKPGVAEIKVQGAH